MNKLVKKIERVEKCKIRKISKRLYLTKSQIRAYQEFLTEFFLLFREIYKMAMRTGKAFAGPGAAYVAPIATPPVSKPAEVIAAPLKGKRAAKHRQGGTAAKPITVTCTECRGEFKPHKGPYSDVCEKCISVKKCTSCASLCAVADCPECGEPVCAGCSFHARREHCGNCHKMYTTGEDDATVTEGEPPATEMEAKRVGVYDRTKYGMSPRAASPPRVMCVWAPMYATPTPSDGELSDHSDYDNRSGFGGSDEEDW